MDVVQTSLSLFAPPPTDRSIVKEYWDGKLEISKNYYVLDSDEDNAKYKNNDSIDVSIVSPTQAAVEQAKSEVRDKMNINRGKI